MYSWQQLLSLTSKRSHNFFNSLNSYIMSTSTFESNIKQIPHKQESVFNTLSDLSNLQRFKDKFEQIKDQIPEDKREQLDKLKDITFDRDSISISAPMVGEIKMHIIEREFPKTIKFEAENSPIPFFFWIQLLPTSETSCKMKLTIKAELNMLIKGMVKKPLEEGIEKVANALAMVPYVD